jgi:CRP/FNR family transcriptional regulator, cyclic AMP receptor protein
VADHPFFHGLAPGIIELADRHAHELHFAPGEFLIREGDAAHELFLIFRGKVALEIATPDRPRLTIQTIGPREVLGWSWLVAPFHWRFDARAVKETVVLRVDGPPLVRAFEARPEDGYRFLQRLLPVIGERLEMARIQILDIHGN